MHQLIFCPVENSKYLDMVRFFYLSWHMVYHFDYTLTPYFLHKSQWITLANLSIIIIIIIIIIITLKNPLIGRHFSIGNTLLGRHCSIRATFGCRPNSNITHCFTESKLGLN